MLVIPDGGGKHVHGQTNVHPDGQAMGHAVKQIDVVVAVVGVAVEVGEAVVDDPSRHVVVSSICVIADVAGRVHWHVAQFPGLEGGATVGIVPTGQRVAMHGFCRHGGNEGIDGAPVARLRGMRILVDASVWMEPVRVVTVLSSVTDHVVAGSGAVQYLVVDAEVLVGYGVFVGVAEHPQIGHIPGGTVDVGTDPDEHGPQIV